ncbi:site-specific integrase [Candidatus Bathyarchaeota archaeon]|nr:site-specific integrase [Candidatus Bathyarchaeota archaeon]
MNKKQLEEWAAKYAEVSVQWLPKLQAKRGSTFDLWRYCQWSKMSPPELIALKKNSTDKDAEKLLDRFVADPNTGFTNSAKWKIALAVKSFYSHNYCDLARKSGTITLGKVRPYNKPTKENLRKLYRFCQNPRDRSLLTLVCSTAIAKESLSNLKWKRLEKSWVTQEVPHISLPPQLIKGHGIGKYQGVRQETFLTPEAKRDLLEYKSWMENKLGREFVAEDNIYWTVDKPYNPLSYKSIGRAFTALRRNSGVQFSPHDARRYVNTALESIRMPANWARKIRGRKVRGEESPYSQPAIEQLRTCFKEAVPHLEFTVLAKPTISERDLALIEFKRALKKAESLGINTNELLAGQGLNLTQLDTWSLETVENAIEALKPKTATNGGGHKIITEAELLVHLDSGWEIAHELQNGRIVVKRKA